jgi:hypothetical protein
MRQDSPQPPDGRHDDDPLRTALLNLNQRRPAMQPAVSKMLADFARTQQAMRPAASKILTELARTRRVTEPGVSKMLADFARTQQVRKPAVSKMLSDLLRTQQALAPAVLPAMAKLAETQRAMQPGVSKMLSDLLRTQQALAPAVLPAMAKLAETQRAMQPGVSKMLSDLLRTQQALAPAVLPAMAKLAETQRAMQPGVSKMLTDLARTQRAMAPSVVPAMAKLAERQPRFHAQLLTRPRPAIRPPPPSKWLLAQGMIRTRIIGVLTELDVRLEARLDGAWERVSRGGPDAASQAANSLVELLDWALRFGAPDEEALEWHVTLGRAADELRNGKPTRALRARYLLKHRNPDGPVANLYIRQLCDTHRLLERIKHGQDSVDLRTMACLASTTEAILTFLFMPQKG